MPIDGVEMEPKLREFLEENPDIYVERAEQEAVIETLSPPPQQNPPNGN